jgi:hypothetical protein
MDYENKQKHVIFSSFGQENNKILVFAHKHKTLKMLSLTAGNVPSALCRTILATLVARECRIFCILETCFIT